MSTLSRLLNPKRLSSSSSSSSIRHTSINHSRYAHPTPSKPVIAISIDGCDVRHLNRAVNHHMPHVYELVTSKSHHEPSTGYMCPTSSVFPTCTRSNQVSMVTGVTPNEHGIVGDYCADGDITDSDSLFADSILTELSHDNVTVLFMCLTEEYREQLTYDFHPNSTSLSLQSLVEYGVNNSDPYGLNENVLVQMLLNDNEIYSALKELSVYFESENNVIMDMQGECGLFMMEIMKKVIENTNIKTPDVNYIAISPTIQYYHDHSSPEMMHYLSEMDGYLKYIHENDIRYAVTSAHGTNYKLGANGDLFIINIKQKLNQCWDLYEKQHNIDVFSLFEYKIILQKKSTSHDMLYGFAHVHITEKWDKDNKGEMDIKVKERLILHTLNYMRNIKGIYSSIGHEEACSSLELPTERMGDVLLLGDIDTVFCDDDDRNNVDRYEWILSHGALDESTVPLILNERPTESYLKMLSKGKARNYHLFDILLNGYDETLQERCPYRHIPTEYPYIGK